VALCLGRPQRFWADFDGGAAFGGAVCRARGIKEMEQVLIEKVEQLFRSNWRGSGFNRPCPWPCRLAQPLGENFVVSRLERHLPIAGFEIRQNGMHSRFYGKCIIWTKSSSPADRLPAG